MIGNTKYERLANHYLRPDFTGIDKYLDRRSNLKVGEYEKTGK